MGRQQLSDRGVAILTPSTLFTNYRHPRRTCCSNTTLMTSFVLANSLSAALGGGVIIDSRDEFLDRATSRFLERSTLHVFENECHVARSAFQTRLVRCCSPPFISW